MRLEIKTVIVKSPGSEVFGLTQLELGGHNLSYVINVIEDKVEITRGELKFVFGGEVTFKTLEERIIATIFGERIFGLIQKAGRSEETLIKDKTVLETRSKSEEKDLLAMFNEIAIRDWEDEGHLPSFRI